jgi:hypothetical protein
MKRTVLLGLLAFLAFATSAYAGSVTYRFDTPGVV